MNILLIFIIKKLNLNLFVINDKLKDNVFFKFVKRYMGQNTKFYLNINKFHFDFFEASIFYP